MRVMVAGVGYSQMRDLSLGPLLVRRLREMEWPDGIEIDDWSYGPIAVVQRLEAEETPYDRIVFVAAVDRGDTPGTVRRYRWNGVLPDPEEVQLRVGEAVMGVISLDNLLIVGGQFQAFPDDVIVVEVEPADTNWGEGLSATVECTLDDMAASIRRVASNGLESRDE